MSRQRRPARGKSRRRNRKAKLYERDGGICQICYEPVAYEDISEDHHPIKFRDGGPTILSNLRLAHIKCNNNLERLEGYEQPVFRNHAPRKLKQHLADLIREAFEVRQDDNIHEGQHIDCWLCQIVNGVIES